MARIFKVQLKKSGAGQTESHRKTLAGLGLTKFGRVQFLKDTPAVRGMLYKVNHLVVLEPVAERGRPSARERHAAQVAAAAKKAPKAKKTRATKSAQA